MWAPAIAKGGAGLDLGGIWQEARVPFSEDDDRTLGPTTRSRWSYACSKALDEFMALAYHKQLALPVVIARFFNTVGPRQSGRYGMVIPRFVRQALSGEPVTIYGDGQQSRCFAYVEDVVRGVVALADCPEAVGQVYNVGSTEEVTIEQLAQRVIALSGSQSELVYIPYGELTKKGSRICCVCADIRKIRDAVGWEPTVDLDGILTRVIASMRIVEQTSRWLWL